MLKTILTALFVAGASIASAQTAEEQQQADIVLTYKVICASDAELSADAELLQIVGGNPGAAKTREGLQAFVASPKAAIEAVVASAAAAAPQIKAQIIEKEAAALQAEAEKYMKEKGGTIEEAKEAILNDILKTVLGNEVYSVTSVSCDLLNYTKTEIAKTGCKAAATGEAMDLAAATQFCSSISAQTEQVAQTSAQLNAIQQQAQALIAAVTQTIQRDAETQMAPLMESMNTPIEEIIAAALNLAGTPAPVEAPVAAPAQN